MRFGFRESTEHADRRSLQEDDEWLGTRWRRLFQRGVDLVLKGFHDAAEHY